MQKKKHSCFGCIYAEAERSGREDLICTYILKTKKRRPCPAGKGCTVKKQGKLVRRITRSGEIKVWEIEDGS